MSCLTKEMRSKRSRIDMLDRLCAATEVILLVGFVLMMTWVVPRTGGGARFYSGATVLTWAFGLMIMSHISYGESLDDLGLGGKNIGRAFAELALPVACLAVLLVVIGLTLGTLHLQRKFFLQLAGIPVWALFQQYITQSFVNRRLQIIFGPGVKSAALTAVIFAAVHLPNPLLTIATAVAGYMWARSYQRAPNLYAIALSHGLLSTLFANVMPKWLLPNMVVGYNYLLK
ncbi:MAG: CPBP family glutamic-type intramembrane protease [Acidobacteriota bacterium]